MQIHDANSCNAKVVIIVNTCNALSMSNGESGAMYLIGVQNTADITMIIHDAWVG